MIILHIFAENLFHASISMIYFIKITIQLFMIIPALISCVNCGNNVTEHSTVDSEKYRIVSVKDITADEMLEYFSASMSGGHEENVEQIRKLFSDKIMQHQKKIGDALCIEKPRIGYRQVVYTYNSTDQHGDKIELSAVVCWERFEHDGWHDAAPDGIALMEHYTITDDAESPSHSFPLDVAILMGKLVVAPDYIGYGVSKNSMHPYLNYDVAAENSVDALVAGYEIYSKMSSAGMHNNWKTVVLGASQGGGNALAVHKYMDTNPAEAAKWNFAGSLCAAGPYSPSLTIQTYMEWGTTEYPVVIPLVLKTMIDSYPDVMSQWSEDDFYSDTYLKIKPQIDEMIASKEHTAKEINGYIFSSLLDDDSEKKISIDYILDKDALKNEPDMMKSLFECFAKNDLTTGWTPTHPIMLYHSMMDSVVPFSNALALQNAYGKEKVTIIKDKDNNKHGMSCATWMLSLFVNGIRMK